MKKKSLKRWERADTWKDTVQDFWTYNILYRVRKFKLWCTLHLVPARYRKIYFVKIHSLELKDEIKNIPYTNAELKVKYPNVQERAHVKNQKGTSSEELMFSDPKNHWIKMACEVTTPTMKVWELSEKEPIEYRAHKWVDVDEVLMMKETLTWQDIARGCLEYCTRKKLAGEIYLDGTKIGQVHREKEYTHWFRILIPNKNKQGKILHYSMIWDDEKDTTQQERYQNWIRNQCANLSLVENIAKNAQRTFIKKERK